MHEFTRELARARGAPKSYVSPRVTSRDIPSVEDFPRELPLMGHAERTSQSLISLDGQSTEFKIQSRVALNKYPQSAPFLKELSKMGRISNSSSVA